MKIGAIIDADILIMVFGTLREDLFPSSERNNCLTCGSVTVDITKLDTGELCIYAVGLVLDMFNLFAKLAPTLIKC